MRAGPGRQIDLPEMEQGARVDFAIWRVALVPVCLVSPRLWLSRHMHQLCKNRHPLA